MKIKINNYSFDASGKTIAFTDYTSINLDGILLVTNVTRNIIIYNFASPAKGGTVSDNVLSLTYDTTAMSDGDKLQIFYEDGVAGTDKLVVRDVEGGGKILVGTTPVKLEFSVKTDSIIITAWKDNLGVIYFGKSNITSDGSNCMGYLEAGDIIEMEYDDSLNDLYVVASEAGQYVVKGATKSDLVTMNQSIEVNSPGGYNYIQKDAGATYIYYGFSSLNGWKIKRKTISTGIWQVSYDLGDYSTAWDDRANKTYSNS